MGIGFAPIWVRLSELGPVSTAFYRMVLALPVLAVWFALENRTPPRSRRPASISDYRRLALAGLFFAGDLAVWHWSLQLTFVANATLLANFSPVYVALGSWLLFGERFRPQFLIGMVLALAGAVVLMGRSLDLGGSHFLGDGLALLAAAFYGAYLLTVSRLRAEFSTATILGYSGVISALALWPLAWFSGEGLIAPSWTGWWILIGLAWISHVGGQGLIGFALAHLPAAFSAVALLIQPIAAAVFAWLILSEELGVWQAVGGVIVLIGIGLARRGSRDRPS